MSKSEMSNFRWKVGGWLIELPSESKFCECRGKIVDWLVEITPKREMSE